MQVLFRDLERAHADDEPLHGVALGLAKAFDSVTAPQAVRILERLGLPPAAGSLIRRFYADHIRWCEFDGTVARQGVAPAIGLMQGDAWAPMLLIGAMLA